MYLLTCSLKFLNCFTKNKNENKKDLCFSTHSKFWSAGEAFKKTWHPDQLLNEEFLVNVT